MLKINPRFFLPSNDQVPSATTKADFKEVGHCWGTVFS